MYELDCVDLSIGNFAATFDFLCNLKLILAYRLPVFESGIHSDCPTIIVSILSEAVAVAKLERIAVYGVFLRHATDFDFTVGAASTRVCIR